MRPFSVVCRLGLVVLLLLTGGCAVFEPPKPKPPVPQPQAKKSYWQGDGVTGDPSILIDLGEQRAHFFKGRTEVGQAVISSGKNGFETPRGEFKVIQRDLKHVSNLYGDFVEETGTVVKRNVDASKEHPPEGASFRGAKMPYFLRFHGGTGMHAGVVPNFRASHGCVRLPRFMAEHFFENAPLGTPVTVSSGASAGETANRQIKKEGEPAKDPTKTAKTAAKPAKTPPTPAETPAKAIESPAKPAETAPPAPVLESGKKADEETVKKPEPATPPAVPPSS